MGGAPGRTLGWAEGRDTLNPPAVLSARRVRAGAGAHAGRLTGRGTEVDGRARRVRRLPTAARGHRKRDQRPLRTNDPPGRIHRFE